MLIYYEKQIDTLFISKSGFNEVKLLYVWVGSSHSEKVGWTDVLMYFKNLILPFLSLLEAIIHLYQADLIFFHQGT